MAYTRNWDNAAPPGSAQANTLDTIIQNFRTDTQQRISSLLAAGTTIDTDPLQLKTDAIGAVTGAVRGFNPFAGGWDNGVGSKAVGLDGADGLAHLVGVGGGFVTGAFDVAAACQMPPNAQFTRMRLYGNRVTGFGTTRARLYTLNLTVGTYTLIHDFGALPTTGYNIMDTGVLAPVLLGNFNLLIIRVNGTATPSGSIECAIGGCLVTYNLLAGTWVP